jgi:hypothetical protein
MPSVTVWLNWNGFPIASTHSATFSLPSRPTEWSAARAR